MKIGILSDLHVDVNYRKDKNIISNLCRIIEKNQTDILMIAGDVSNNYQVTLDTLNEIEKITGVRCLFVPGNHDIWNIKYPEKTAWDIYSELQSFSGNLSREPFKLNNDWIVIGDLGWYDYSFGNPKFTQKEFDEMEFEGRLWQDKICAKWGRSTIEVHHYFYKKLKLQLEEHKDKNIILLTHAVPHKDFTVKYPSPIWPYFNAFLGSKEYGELVFDYSVKYAIFGHVHYRTKKIINETTFICNCLGYTKEWRHSDNSFEEINRAFEVIEI